MSKVGVIMPTHMRAELIDRAWASVLAQTHQDWEAVVVGNGMTEAEWSEYNLAPDERLKLMANYPHFANLAQACQFGLAFLSNDVDYVCVMEDDDEWDPQFMEIMAGALDDRPPMSMSYCDEIELDPDGVQVDWTGHPTEFTRVRLLEANWIHFPCQMWRYDRLMGAGGFSWETSGAADWDIAIRMSAWGVVHVRLPLVVHHWLTDRHDPNPLNNCLRPERMETANKWIDVRRKVGLYR